MPTISEIASGTAVIVGSLGGWGMALLQMRAAWASKRDYMRERLLDRQQDAYQSILLALAQVLADLRHTLDENTLRLEFVDPSQLPTLSAGLMSDEAGNCVRSFFLLARRFCEWAPFLPKEITDELETLLGPDGPFDRLASAVESKDGAEPVTDQTRADTEFCLAELGRYFDRLLESMRRHIGTDRLTAESLKLVNAIGRPPGPPSGA